MLAFSEGRTEILTSKFVDLFSRQKQIHILQDPLVHFRGGFFCEGNDQDLLVFKGFLFFAFFVIFGKIVQDRSIAFCQGKGLARSGTGLNENRSMAIKRFFKLIQGNSGYLA